ncbi:hypothetical protein [Massilia endophytica]|uniref:hypothetical protein n=1 Tax=Massilia endophytica TaxID=2899220 RepID=UPI001E3BBCF6|nr:hypothetical protein [Massilia endophytica]UGQ45577.1 hypothetical protein LSQ66_17540 [Massilia endophytica]
MNWYRICIASALALFSLAHATERKEEGSPPKALSGDYQIYGGTLSEMQAPTARDRKVAFMFKGPLAKDLFNQIGPDAKDACSAATGYRERRRGHLVCTRDEDGYLCYFGLDVPTGKSTYGVIC